MWRFLGRTRAAFRQTARIRRLSHIAEENNLERALAASSLKHAPDQQRAEDFGHLEFETRQLVEALEELDAKLPMLETEDDLTVEFDKGNWFLAPDFEVLAPKKILRGFLYPVRTLPGAVPVTAKVFAFLTINGSRDLLDRHLFQGIHYHYALADETHTTTMLCWDTRWHPVRKDEMRPLFHELHAVGKKHVSARPERWGDAKRTSVREACEPDLKDRMINEFRCASNDATSVWPKNRVVTPHPKQASKSKSKRG